MASPAPDADLPQSIRELIAKVVRRTGLWLREKRDVRPELASHFREGMIELAGEKVSADRAAVVLCEQFGNPRVAARLIRRAKKRQRPRIWKAFVVAWRGFLVTMILLAMYVGWIFTGKPSPSIDYVAKLNAAIDLIPESDRGWPIFRHVVAELSPISKELSNAGRDIHKLTRADAEWPALLAWVESNRHLLPDIKRAAHRRICGYPYDNRESQRLMWEMARRYPGESKVSDTFTENPQDPLAPRLNSLLLPPINYYRQAARLLVIEARIRMESGDFEGAWEWVDTAHRLGNQLLALNTLIEQLVGVAIIQLSCDSARQLLYSRENALTPAEVRLTRASHLMTSPPETIQANLRFERDNFEDMVQYLFTDGGLGGGHLIPRQLARMSFFGNDQIVTAGPAVVHAGRKATLAKYRELWDRMDTLRRLPLNDPQREQADKIIEKLRSDPIDKVRYSLVLSMLPSFNCADRQFRLAAMDQAATQTVVALLAYRVDHRRLPNRLQELVPDYLEHTPIDVYRGDELRYRVSSDRSFALYSVGENQADDGGRSTFVDANCDNCSGRVAADIVYWPPLGSVAGTQPISTIPGR